MSDQPLVSVILTAYNSEAYIADCIEAFANQTLADIEVLVMDDGSQDGTLEIARQYAAKDDRIRAFTHENVGPGENRNAGLAQAQGRYVFFADDDDRYLPTLLEKMSSALEANGADAALCDATSFDFETGEEDTVSWRQPSELLKLDRGPVFSGHVIADRLFQDCTGWAWDKMFRRSFLDELGLKFPDMSNSEDGPFVLPVLALCDRIVVVDEALVAHTVSRAGSMSNTRGKDPTCLITEVLLIRQNIEQHTDFEPFKASYLTWALGFIRWHYETLDEDARQVALDDMRKRLFPALDVAHTDDRYFYYTNDLIWYGMIASLDGTTLEHALQFWADRMNELEDRKRDVTQLSDQLKERDEQIQQRDDKIEQIRSLYDQTVREREDARRSLDEIKRSKSFQLGEALANPVRKITGAK
jgi:glycosyltransferase involved in cell wall biosynthesis